MKDTPDNTPKGDILVVDDTPANLRLLSGMLVEHGYKVRSAPNGRLALMGARAAPPDLILLDINMPGLNGYQVCEQLKDDPQTHDIPVIFISALDQTEDKVQAFTLGGVDYITKPFQLEEVLARVETHLTLHRLQRQLVAANQDLQASNQKLADANHALVGANAELEASNAELNAFAHTVAHDLKTPLTAVIGFSSLLEARFSEMPSEKVLGNLQRITHTGYKMRDIIDELLLLASVRQVDEIEIGPLDTGMIVAEALQRLEQQIGEMQAEIRMPDAWPAALGYAPWIEEVWVNYISNGLKYGGQPDGDMPPHVDLGFSVVDVAMPNTDTVAQTSAVKISAVKFWVRDNGPGLSPEEQQQMFTPFTRLHQTRSDGHGLGLSIVQRIIKKLGGDVGVESAGIPGRGCTFWFTLPI